MSVRIICLVAVSLAFAGCNAFDPDLSDTPFRCGETEPVCPEGYACSGEVCQRITGDDEPALDAPQGADAALIDAPPTINCVDAEEENDTTATATSTGIPDASSDHRYPDLSICDDDVDLFRFSLTAGDTAVVQVETGNGAPLSVAILSATGEPIAKGEPVDGDPTRLEVIAMPPAGMDYFAEVRAIAGGENAYEILITAAPPAR